MTIQTNSFKITPTQCYARVMHVRRRYRFPMMDKGGNAAATLTLIKLAYHKSLAATSPRWTAVKFLMCH
jgi:hypothetical protein